MNPDLVFLKRFIADAETLARRVRESANREGGKAFFTVGSTTKTPEGARPYLTPMRRILSGFIAGAEVFTQTQAVLLCHHLDGMVDDILVDAEKKIGIRLGSQDEILSYFGLSPFSQKKKARAHVEMGNLSSACAEHVSKSRFQEYKPNDLAVEAVWHFLSHRYRVLSGRKIAVIGGGNIGFKIALKLVESGANVELVRRDLRRGMMMADVINIAKPRSTIAVAHYNAEPLQASLFADALIGCTDGTPAITWEMIQSMKTDGVVVDVAKGSVHADAVTRSVEAGIPLMRCDVSSAIDGAIATTERNRVIASQEMGRREIADGIHVVSGGFLGLHGDIVVDSFRRPRLVIGVADGCGDLVAEVSDSQKGRMARVLELGEGS